MNRGEEKEDMVSANIGMVSMCNNALLVCLTRPETWSRRKYSRLCGCSRNVMRHQNSLFFSKKGKKNFFMHFLLLSFLRERRMGTGGQTQRGRDLKTGMGRYPAKKYKKKKGVLFMRRGERGREELWGIKIGNGLRENPPRPRPPLCEREIMASLALAGCGWPEEGRGGVG